MPPTTPDNDDTVVLPAVPSGAQPGDAVPVGHVPDVVEAVVTPAPEEPDEPVRVVPADDVVAPPPGTIAPDATRRVESKVHSTWNAVGRTTLGAALAVTLVLLAFAWPTFASRPKDLPVSLVGAPAQVAKVKAQLDAQGDLYFVTTAVDRQAAIDQINERQSYGAIVVPAKATDQIEVITATAASPVVAAGLGQVAAALGRQAGTDSAKARTEAAAKAAELSAKSAAAAAKAATLKQVAAQQSTMLAQINTAEQATAAQQAALLNQARAEAAAAQAAAAAAASRAAGSTATALPTPTVTVPTPTPVATATTNPFFDSANKAMSAQVTQAEAQAKDAATMARDAAAAVPTAGTTAGVKVTDIVPLSTSDPRGAGLAVAGLPLAMGGMIGGVLIALLLVGAQRRMVAIAGYAIVGGVLLAAVLQGWFHFLQGSAMANVAAIMLSLAATSAVIVGLHALIGRIGIPIGAILTLFIGNPLASLTTPKEFLPSPWGDLGQYFVPGATGTLLKSISYFPEASTAPQWLTLLGWLVLGAGLGLFGRFRNQEVVHVDGATELDDDAVLVKGTSDSVAAVDDVTAAVVPGERVETVRPAVRRRSPDA